MSEIINAEYQVVPERTPEVIRAEIKTIEAQVFKITLEGVIGIGRKLSELKEIIGHGSWLKWCEENLGYGERQVQRYMKISAEYGAENSRYSKATSMTDLSISKAYSLLAVPENEVEEFAEQHEIGAMKVSELEAEIREWKSKNEKLTAELGKAELQNQTLQKTVEESEQRHRDLMKDMNELKAVDPDEVEKMKQQLEEEKAKVQKAKDDLAKEKEKTQAEITKAVDAKAVELQQALEEKQYIEMQRLERQKRIAEERVMELTKRLEQSGAEDLVMFKMKAEEMQLNFRDIKEAILKVQQQDPAQADKMRCAMRTVLEKFEEGIK